MTSREFSDRAGNRKADQSVPNLSSLSSPSVASSKTSSPYGLSIEVPVAEELRLPPPALLSVDRAARLPLSQLQTPLTSRQNSLSEDATQRLHDVVRLQNLRGLREQLESSPTTRVDRADEDGYTPLMVAAALDTILARDMVQELIDAGADLERRDKEGFTALHWAAAVGTVATLKVLAKANANVDAASNAGDTPLHRATLLGRVEAVEALVDHCHANAKVHNNNGELASQIACNLLVSGNATPEDSARILALQQQIHRIILAQSPGLMLSVFYHADCMEHIAGTTHQESPRRLQAILDTLHSDPGFSLDEPVTQRRSNLATDMEEADVKEDEEEEKSEQSASAETTTALKMSSPSCLAFVSEFDLAPIESVQRIHSEQYVRFVKMLADSLGPEESVPFTPRVQRTLFGVKTPRAKPAAACDTSFSKATLRAALRASGAAISAVDAVLQPELGYGRRAFCCVRPPGHHAGIRGLGLSALRDMKVNLDGAANVPESSLVAVTPLLKGASSSATSSESIDVPDSKSATLAESASCGFCIFNNVCVAAAHALSRYRMTVKRVAIIDIDVHHGNGTEEIVKMLNSSNVRVGRPPSIFFASTHLFDRKFYPGTGQGDDLCGCCMNLPLYPLWEKRSPFSEESGRGGWRSLIKNRLLFSLRCFIPTSSWSLPALMAPRGILETNSQAIERPM